MLTTAFFLWLPFFLFRESWSPLRPHWFVVQLRFTGLAPVSAPLHRGLPHPPGGFPSALLACRPWHAPVLGLALCLSESRSARVSNTAAPCGFAPGSLSSPSAATSSSPWRSRRTPAHPTPWSAAVAAVVCCHPEIRGRWSSSRLLWSARLLLYYILCGSRLTHTIYSAYHWWQERNHYNGKSS